LNILNKRRKIQVLSALGFNIYLPAWLRGEIYQGGTKGVCVPILNCPSCPSAIGACPVGSLQNFFSTMKFNFSIDQYQIGFYVLGTMGLFGSLGGRIPCGWLCPFGLIQELMHKIPSAKFSVPKFLHYLKYVILVLTVILLPLLILDEFALGSTWFCKWICPAGTLEAGIPLMVLNQGIRGQLGPLFVWKMAVLLLFLVWMILSNRPFCRTTCPLGAILGLFNRVSLFRMEVDDTRCAQCNTCQKNCPVELKPHETPNSPECVRCLRCVSSCEYGAISFSAIRKERKLVNL